MMPHPYTVSVLAKLRQKEILDSVTRARLAQSQPRWRSLRRTAVRATLAAVAGLIARGRSSSRGLFRAAKLGERLPPAT